MRTNPTQLGNKEELLKMRESEGKRPPLRKEHFPRFEVLINWLSYLAVDPSYFIKEDFTLDDYNVEIIDKIKTEIIEKTLNNIDDDKLINLLKKVTEYLGEEDTLEISDIIFVFGGKDIKRIEKAVEIYNQGVVHKILITGRSPFYIQDHIISEAERFRDRAIELGIPKSSILIEKESVNIFDNIKRGLNLLDELNESYNSIIQVISWYANRRAYCALQKRTPYNTKIIRINPELTDKELKQDNWFLTARGIEIVVNEFFKMKTAITSDSV